MLVPSARRILLLLPICALLGLAGVFAAQTMSATAADSTAGLSVSPNPLTFDDVNVGSSQDRMLTVRSVGTAPVDVTSVENIGRDASDFSIVGDECTGKEIAPGATCAVTVRFRPTVSTTRISNIRLQSSNACAYTVNMAGGGHTSPSTAASARAVATCTPVAATVTTPAATVTGATVTTPGATTTTAAPAPVTASAASSSPSPAPVAAPVPTKATVASGVSITSPKMCTSRRTITLHISPRKGVSYTKIVIRRDGRVIKVLRSTKREKIVERVALNGLPRKRVKVSVAATDVSGQRSIRTQYLVTCVPKAS